MSHRVFIAINLPDDIKGKLVGYQKKIDKLFISHSQVTGTRLIKWTKKENLHITLVFIGYTKDEDFPEILKITKGIVQKYNSFSINLNKICYGPPKKMPPRMVWAVGEKSERLGKLQKELENSLLGSLPKKPPKIESRAYSPHITMGRIRKWEFRKIEPEERPEIKEDTLLSFSANSIEVMESQLKREGAEYTILESIPLSN